MRRSPRGRRALVVLALGVLGSLAQVDRARADVTPEQVQFAEQEDDLGIRAYTAKNFDAAATHFENAYFAAPKPEELRKAIRARKEAGQLARAATLAAIGQRAYPADAALVKLADDTIAEARPRVSEVHVTSPLECNVVVDDKVVLLQKARDLRFFVDPGMHEVVIGWGEGRVRQVKVDARAGNTETLAFTPPPVPAKPPPPAPVPPPQPPASRPLGPAVFFVGTALTAAGVGVTIWSGLDAEKNPGTAAVRTDCVGQGTSCPQYQQGLDAQRRTNILLAATGGVAVVTAVIGLFLTQWSSEGGPSNRTGLTLEPALGVGQAALIGTF